MRNYPNLLFSAIFMAAFSLTALSACQNKAENKTMDNTNQVASGKFMDAPFTFVTGKVAEHPFDSSKIEFILFGETPKGDMCDDFNFDLPKKSIIFATAKAVGVYPITQKDAVSFNNAETNNSGAVMVSDGNIEIVSISETTITGKINVASKDGKNTLNGTFTANVCK